MSGPTLVSDSGKPVVWDVVVAGAGPAGAVAAYVLARAGRRVLLVDALKPGTKKVGESLPGAARRLLHDLDLLALVDAGPHITSYGNASAWGSGELITTDFIRDPYGLGWHLDRPRFDADLRMAAQKVGVTCLQGQVVRILSKNDVSTEGGWRVIVKNDQDNQDDQDDQNGHFAHEIEIEARWLIDATGRRAFIARSQGSKRLRDAPLVALYTWITADLGNLGRDTRTLVEATPDGWWYTALLPNQSRVIAFHVDAQDAAHILKTPHLWLKHLRRTQHIRHCVPEHYAPGTKQMAPLRGTDACGARLTRFAGQGWIAAGDAALSFDPLSSQGMLNALYTGMKSGQAVHAALDEEWALIDAYRARLEAIRAAYLRHYEQFYQSERRWPNHTFWSRRQILWQTYLQKLK